MPIAVCLLGCEHPHVADVLGVIVSEPDVRLAAVWSGDPAAVPGPAADYRVEDPDTAIARMRSASTGRRPAGSGRGGPGVPAAGTRPAAGADRAPGRAGGS